MTITEMEIHFPGGQKVDAQYEGFTIHTDQPVEDGGNNSAPTPFSLFLASIGTCTGYYVVAFCEKRGISTKGIKVVAHIDRNPTTYMVEKFTVDIHVPKDFPEQYKNAMVKAAEHCTVKKHLVKPPQIVIAVVP